MHSSQANNEINKALVNPANQPVYQILVDVFVKQIKYSSFCYEKVDGSCYTDSEMIYNAKKHLTDAVIASSVIRKEVPDLNDYECIVIRNNVQYNFNLSVVGNLATPSNLHSVVLNLVA